ncbi:MAG: hypothetical protein AAGH90_09560 [Pseudomonadota bacterium]
MKIRIALFALAMTPIASAAPVTMQEAIKELKDRGALIGDSALIYGKPMISAEFDEQGYRLVLSQCEKPNYACNITIFSACQIATPLKTSDLISFANTQNQKPTARGTVYTDKDGGLGDVICIRSRRDLHSEDIFDLTDVFTWHSILGDFTDAVEEEKRRITVRDLLGITEDETDIADLKPTSPSRN